MRPHQCLPMLFGEGSTMNTNQSTYLRLLLTTMLALGLIFSAPRVAWAATITVTTTDDELNADGDCSLREAVAAANNDTATDACPAGNGADSITVPAGTYGFTTAAELLITEDLTIVGAGRGATIIDANGLSRAVYINVSQVTISHLTIREGNASFSAGSNVYVGASSYLTLVSARLTAVPSGADRALWVRIGSGATVIDSRIDGNANGGVYVQSGGSILIRESSITNNTSETSGGGLDNNGSAVVINSTISGNSADTFGGGVSNGGTLFLGNVTVANNTAGLNGTLGDGGGIMMLSGVATLQNTIVADNVDLAPNSTNDCLGSLVSAGYNLVENMSGCTFTGDLSGNQTGVDPMLSALAANGGGTLTHALQAGSPAIQGGNPTGCLDDLETLLTVDQRGYIRPVNTFGAPGTTCDIGAYEYASPGTPVPTATSTATNTSLPTATWTSTPTRTSTLAATATRTNTVLPPTATATRTNTAVPSTATATRTNTTLPPVTATASATWTPPNTATATRTPTATPTRNCTPSVDNPPCTATPTGTLSATPTATSTPSATTTPTITKTPTATFVVVVTQPATATPFICDQVCLYLPELQKDWAPPPTQEPPPIDG